ncbi:50S ribosomal protein L24 [Candidatus Woesearchaeota archaeon]|nr:50S ribosomal protein L24 [Candidatus Woesearchaeota archaeon]
MKKKFSTAWKGSKQPRKQRKYRHNAPLHVRSSFMNVMLSKELVAKHKVKRLRIRLGDKVKVMRGKNKGKEGKVDVLNVKKSNVKMTGVEVSKKDGSKAKAPIQVSNLMIVELNLDDKKRLESKKAAAATAPAPKKAKALNA